MNEGRRLPRRPSLFIPSRPAPAQTSGIGFGSGPE